MSDKIINFISGKLRIFSLLIILVTIIIQVNGGSGLSRQLSDSRRSSQSSHSQSCQSNHPITLMKAVQERISNLLQEESVKFTKIVKPNIKHCGKNGEITFSIRVPLAEGRKIKEFKYLVYVDDKRNIIDVRSMDKIMAEKKRLKKMRDSKEANAAELSEPMLKDIEERILQRLQEESATAVIPKKIVKTKLLDYDEIANEIEYYVNFQTINGIKTKDNEYSVYVRYTNGKQEITDIKSKEEYKLKKLKSYS